MKNKWLKLLFLPAICFLWFIGWGLTFAHYMRINRAIAEHKRDKDNEPVI